MRYTGPHRHTAALPWWVCGRGYPHGFHRGLAAGRHPTFAGCGQFDMHGAFYECERGWFAYLYGHAITKQRPFSHAPRACGVLPCIKPTVKTVGASPRARQFTERRRMAVWIHANARILTALVGTNHCIPPTLVYAESSNLAQCLVSAQGIRAFRAQGAHAEERDVQQGAAVLQRLAAV